MTRVAIAATWADLVTFLGMLALLGPAAEANPLLRPAIAAGMLVFVVTAKILLLIVLALWHAAVHRLERTVALVGLAVGVVGAASNLRAVAG